ncbi:MAG TPA: hypothetical protein VHB21_18005, partial [Minicystis sp.]|nr:hypothetical protein [Minicystis sp.]
KPGDGYDVGEGDGKFTVARGLQEFWDRDAHSIVRGLTDPSKIPGGELNAAALQRLDVWTDGGTRDLFNFSVDAQNLAGAFYARGRDVQYLTEFANAPGQDPKSGNFDPKYTVWEDLPGVVFQRYGATVPSQVAFDDGTGQHVGTGSEIIERVQSAMYFLASRWPEPELRTLSARSKDDPAPGVAQCEIDEKCDFDFSHGGRTGPVSVALPPGYGNRFNQQQRYPVIYFLHGYGQDPSGLSSVEALFTNWMADPAASIATRFPKVIVVYVDGRCRWQNGKAECLRGSFFTDSVMAQGSQDESWWLALMDEVDRRFRTMPEGAADWTE